MLKSAQNALSHTRFSRLKIERIQYQLDAKGSTPAEVMGIDPKLTLKPALNSFADDIKKSSMKKLEESMSLQQRCSENAARIEKKRKNNDELLSRIDEVSGSFYITLEIDINF